MKKSTSTVLVLGVSLLFLLISGINNDANAVAVQNNVDRFGIEIKRHCLLN